MDRRTFVKASCVGSASLFLDGIDPRAFSDVTLPEPPPIEVVHGPKPAKSPLGMAPTPGNPASQFPQASIPLPTTPAKAVSSSFRDR